MKLTVVSADNRVSVLCREVLNELSSDWEFSRQDPSAEPGPSDMYLWDFRPGLQVPTSLDRADLRRHLFLVSAKHLSVFQSACSPGKARILLKPVTRVALRAFLADQDELSAGVVDTLRSERDELLRCLLHTNLHLQKYDQERTNFLGRAVHDFQAPLTAILGFSGLLLNGAVGSLTADQADVVQRMARSAKRLSGMASAMVELAVGSSATQPLRLQPGDIRDCVETVLGELRPLGQAKNIKMSLTHFEPPTGPLWFERSKIEQVLVNLLENACQFTPRDGTIEVSGVPYFWDRRLPLKSDCGFNRRLQDVTTPNAYRIDVRDSGPGVPSEHVHEIFEEYSSYRGPHDRAGTGLGLAICKLIVEQHHGRIWAESGNQGALFSFVVPYRRSSGEPPKADTPTSSTLP